MCVIICICICIYVYFYMYICVCCPTLTSIMYISCSASLRPK